MITKEDKNIRITRVDRNGADANPEGRAIAAHKILRLVFHAVVRAVAPSLALAYTWSCGAADNLDQSFQVTTNQAVVGIALQTDGKIIVVGDLFTAGGIARFNSNGTPDASFEPGTGMSGAVKT